MDDRDLMLWALSHGWEVHMSEGGEQTGTTWISPAGSRFSPVDAAPGDADLPTIDDEIRKRMEGERELYRGEREARERSGPDHG